MRCPECGSLIQRKTDTYEYREAGLSNAFLKNVPVYLCSCGEKYPSIFRVGYLNELIAEKLLEKQSLLRGEEIRFLRKNLRFSSKAFATALGIGHTTLSKWENELQKHSDSNDRLIRAIYMIFKGSDHEAAVTIWRKLSHMKLSELETADIIVAEFTGNDYIVTRKEIAEACTQKRPAWNSLTEWPETGYFPELTLCTGTNVETTSASSEAQKTGSRHI
jgi:putative zinc finger/helix-turn-helix YgiT family protein